MPIRYQSEFSGLLDPSKSGALRLIGYLLLCSILMVSDHHWHYLTSMRTYTSYMLNSIYWLAQAPSRALDNAIDLVISRNHLLNENAQLRGQVIQKQAQLMALAYTQQQNTQLRQMLGAQLSIGLDGKLGELLNIDLGVFQHRMLLNIGENQGIHLGDAVIDANGVMGQIAEVYPNRAAIILISDPNHALPVQIVRNGLRALIYGTGDVQILHLADLPENADVQLNDQLITSGMGGKFPNGLTVGTIQEIQTDHSNLRVQAIVKAAADINRSRLVLVLNKQRITLSSEADASNSWVGPPELIPSATPISSACQPSEKSCP